MKRKVLGLAVVMPVLVTAGLGMSGCLQAELSVSPAPDARFVDETITYTGIARNASNKGRKLTYSFDLDGDGLFEVQRGQSGEATSTYGSPQTLRVGLHIVDRDAFLGFGAVATDSELVTILERPPDPPNQGPGASLTATPNPAVAGSTVRLDAGGSRDPDGQIVRYEFDTNGDGLFEESQTGPILVARFINPGSFLIRLRVTDDDGAQAEAQLRVLVQPSNQSPVASFTAARDGNDVFLHASGSSDPDGTIVRYEWDFTNDGGFDFTSTTSPTAQIVNQPGSTTVRLRVTDDDGATAETTRAVPGASRGRQGPSTAGAGAARQARPSRIRFDVRRGRTLRLGTPMLAGDVLFTDDTVSRGVGTFSGAPDRLDLPSNVRWATQLDIFQSVSTQRLRGEGFMLVRFGGAGSVCLSLSVRQGPVAVRPRGVFGAIGGTGMGRKLAGGGSFVIREANGDSPALRARGAMVAADPRAYPRAACGPLRRLVRG